MKAIFLVFIVSIGMFLIGCGSGGDGDTQTSTPKFAVTKSIASMQETVVEVSGKGNDLLTITIPKLPFGQAEDLEIEFKLEYTEGNVLPEIVINTHIEFDSIVRMDFKSDNFSDDDTLVYYGETRGYFVPFVKNGDTYTAKLLHFSRFKYGSTPTTTAQAMYAIETALTELGTYTGDDGINGLDKNLIGDIFGYIDILERVDPLLEHTYREQMLAIINKAVERWLAKMKTVTLNYWDGYCISGAFKDYTIELIQTMTELELIGSTYVIDDEVNKLLNTHLGNAYEAWKSVTAPRACDISNMLKYINCAQKFLTEAELAGYDGSTVDMEKRLPEYVEENVQWVLANAVCPDIDCVKYYLGISKSNELEYWGIEGDYTEQLQAKLDEIEQKIEDDTCIAPLWKFHVEFISVHWGNGEMTIKNFPLNLEGLNGPFYIFVGNDYESYEEETSISYQGGLYYDDGLSPLILDDDYIEWTAMINIQQNIYQVGSSIIATGEDCDGTLPSNILEDLQSGKKVEWSSPQGAAQTANCNFTIEPCLNSQCD